MALLTVMHIALQKFYEFYNYVSLGLSIIGAIYVGEICSITGIESFNNCAFILFSYSLGMCINLSTSWKFTASCVAGSMVYFL